MSDLARQALISMAKEADGDADVLIRKMMKHGRENGHGSMHLSALIREEDELIEAGILDPIS